MRRPNYFKDYYKKNREKILIYGRAKSKRLVQQLRQQVLDAYGRTCHCCGENEEKFLTIDHIRNDGANHRKQIGRGTAVYIWLKKNNWPEGFQTLCMNCNWAKRYGECPHEV